MVNIVQSLGVLTFVLGLQIAVYAVFLRPFIFSWGATKEELNRPLTGDNLVPFISSTRAITIKAPTSEVWQWIIQLGADRGGFFSYTLLEKALGYKAREGDPMPIFQEMAVGRIIPGSIDESKSIIQYNFSVVAVEPGQSFVLKDWGAFVVDKINAEQTRLIVRTHGQKLPDLKSKLDYFVMMPLHYIMERRMLMGVKAQAEAGVGVRLSTTADNLWILGIVLSALGIALIAFLSGNMQGVVLTAVYSILWLLALLIVAPKPVYSLSLSAIMVVTSILLL